MLIRKKESKPIEQNLQYGWYSFPDIYMTSECLPTLPDAPRLGSL